MTAPFAALLVIIGIGTGLYGTLVGIGGGFVIVPLLLFLYPQMDPTIVTAISMAVVFCNASSATVAYARMRRIDFRTGVPYALATIPGAMLGARAVAFVSRDTFSIVFGVFLAMVSVFLTLRPQAKFSALKGSTARTIVDRSGQAHTYRANLWAGVGLSFLVGFIASLLGIGGGVVHVPVLISILQFPVHIATATSQFVLVITAFSASIVHLFSGDYAVHWGLVLFLALGVVPGAQIGARLSRRVKGSLIVRLLALALLLAGLRLIVAGIMR